MHNLFNKGSPDVPQATFAGVLSCQGRKGNIQGVHTDEKQHWWQMKTWKDKMMMAIYLHVGYTHSDMKHWFGFKSRCSQKRGKLHFRTQTVTQT